MMWPQPWSVWRILSLCYFYSVCRLLAEHVPAPTPSYYCIVASHELPSAWEGQAGDGEPKGRRITQHGYRRRAVGVPHARAWQ